MVKKSTEAIAVSECKTTCLGVLERVRRTGTSVIVTRRGVPIAEVIPPFNGSTNAGWLGAMRGTATITGDLVSRASESTDWEATSS